MIYFIDITNVLVGNEFCNDETNNADCNYDGGDCCGSCINTDYCSQCACLGEIIGNGVPNALVGDGLCNDETNNADCNYDGGDCCGTCTSMNQCTECACLAGDDDTCHCKPNSLCYFYFSNGVHTG